MFFAYNIGIYLFVFAIRLASLWNGKTRAMIRGRRGWKKLYPTLIPPKKHKRYWFHCASLGEFEMARPVIEQVQVEFPEAEIIVSFFSPSGYEMRKHFLCTAVLYLPFDTRHNAKKWYDIIQPDVAVFVKYEFWLNYMHAGLQAGCHMMAISALFREGQFFFEPWAAAWKQQLQKFRRIFVQNEASAAVGKEEELRNIIVSGDTRFDRVLDTVAHMEPLAEIERFKNGAPLLVCGSTWAEEEKLLFEYLSVKSWPLGWKWIIAPHEVNEAHVTSVMDRLSDYYPIRFSEFLKGGDSSKNKILVMDNVGLLSRIYRYADAAVIGGAWGKGLHNILEAASFGMPVLFGPKHQKFPEAAEGIEAGFCFSAKNYDDFEVYLNRMLGNVELRAELSAKAADWVKSKAGATEMVMDYFRKI